MTTSRRDFLRRSGCAAASAAAFASGLHRFGMVAAYAQGAPATDYKALVCVFLDGGNDAWNMVVNSDDYAGYSAARGTFALPQGSLLPIRPRSDTRQFGLHPNLTRLKALFDQQRLGVLVNVGTLSRPLTRAEYQSGVSRPPNLFSHSDQVAQWQTAHAVNVSDTGWGGRMGDRTSGLNGTATFPLVVSVTGSNLFGIGDNVIPYQISSGGSVALRGFNNSVESNIRYGALQQLLTTDRDHPFVARAGDILTKAVNNDAQLVQALNTAPPLTTVFPTNGFGTQLRTIARLISARNILNMKRQVFFCRLGGFDTHAAQLESHVSLFNSLDAGMNAFYAATVEMGIQNSVTSFTNSDFGRTYRFNDDGTDHAWGSCQFVLGGAVNGGDFYGRWPTLAVGGPDDTGNDFGRFIPTTSVEQYCATLARWFGLLPADAPLVFPFLSRFNSADLGFMLNA